MLYFLQQNSLNKIIKFFLTYANNRHIITCLISRHLIIRQDRRAYCMVIKSVRISEQAVEAIKHMIIDGNFPPGSKFYSEKELSSLLEISRASVREAVRMLEIAGRITVKQGKGIYIAENIKQEYEAFIDWLRNNEEAVFDHFEVRMMLDPQAASGAARKSTSQDITSMKAICSKFTNKVEHKNIAGLISCDEEFHLSLAKATKNQTLIYVMKTMTQTLHEGWISTLHIPGRAEKTCKEHADIVQAIEQKDPRLAEELMKKHLEEAISDVKSNISKYSAKAAYD